MASASDHRAHAALQPADCLFLLPQRLPAAVETSIGPAHYPAECTQSDAFLQPSLRARYGRANSNSFIYGTTLAARVRAEHILYISFLVRRAMQGVVVPDEPHFDEIANPYFRSLIGDCRFYLEFGSGGSTVIAAALNNPLSPSILIGSFSNPSVARSAL